MVNVKRMVGMFQTKLNETASLLYCLKNQPVYLEFIWKSKLV